MFDFTDNTDKNHIYGLYGAIAASFVLSLLGTYFIIQQAKIAELGGRENYAIYQQILKNKNYQTQQTEGLKSTLASMNGETPKPDAPNPAEPAAPTASLDTIKGLFTDGNIHFGSADSKILLVEISDPSCPYCHAASGKNPELSRQMGPQFILKSDGGSYVAPIPEFRKLVEEGKASYAFLYSNGHGAGELATQSMYCAFEKGKFWEVHDQLMTYAGYNKINNEIKNDKANAGKLADFLSGQVDKAFMTSCLESGKYASRLPTDERIAGTIAKRGTPSFLVNTTNFSGAVNYETTIKPTIDALLK